MVASIRSSTAVSSTSSNRFRVNTSAASAANSGGFGDLVRRSKFTLTTLLRMTVGSSVLSNCCAATISENSADPS